MCVVKSDGRIAPKYGSSSLQHIAVDASSTIAGLRKAIEASTGLSTSAYELSSSRSVRHDDTCKVFGDKFDTVPIRCPEFTLVHSPYRAGMQPKGPMKLYIVPEISAKPVTIVCEPNFSFDELADCMEQKIEGFQRDWERFITRGRLLDDYERRTFTLSSSGLKDASFLLFFDCS